MAIIHYLNVCEGDCSIVQHNSGRVSVIDVCNAKELTREQVVSDVLKCAQAKKEGGNFRQKHYAVNPIGYMAERDLDSVFRFVLTHADMDHMDGIKAFFAAFSPLNFWDTNNNVEKDFAEEARYDEDDWKFYKNLRDTGPTTKPKRLTVYSGQTGEFWNKVGEEGGGDGLYVLAPTPALVAEANKCGDYNDCSYVLLYRTANYRIIFGGDSNDKTWEHILKRHKAAVTGVDLLIAPHHGRKSDRCYNFLDVLRPKMTFFGNAKCEHLAYSAWNSRDLPYITNNQANCMLVEIDGDGMHLYVTNEKFARAENQETFYSDDLEAWYFGPIA